MRQDVPPPEEADSWGEYRARLEWEALGRGGLRSTGWRVVAALVFVTGLVCCGYAMTYRHWWLWLSTLAAFAVFGAMSARAVRNIEQEGSRAAQLDVLDRLWHDRVQPGSPRR